MLLSNVKQQPAGMLREWNFTLHGVHQAARCQTKILPSWTISFLDADEIQNIHADLDLDRCPLVPFLSYSDFTSGEHGEDVKREEIRKGVALLYSHIPVTMTLVDFCKRSVQHVLSDVQVADVDGQTNLRALTMGSKLNCSFTLGGHQSFHFRYTTVNKAVSMTYSNYAVGTIIGQRGYLCVVTCPKAHELGHYIPNVFHCHFGNGNNFRLDCDVEYSDVVYPLLKEQQEFFGDLIYRDHSSAISFVLPMHPMRIRPDFLPTQTVGVGSIACLTLEVEVHQKLCDDFQEAETGMPKHKSSSVVLFLDVEDVARNQYPSLMSVDQYSSLKTLRMLETLQEAKRIGTALSLRIGQRVGKCTTMTFRYEGGPTQGLIVKAMMVSTLVGNLGITALYFTKLGHGLFDSHLYLQQHLLKSIVLLKERDLVGDCSRFKAVNIRLTHQDIPRAYSSGPPQEKWAAEHIKALHASNDGRADGATVITVVDGSSSSLAVVPQIYSNNGKMETGTSNADEITPIRRNSGDIIDVSNIPHLSQQQQEHIQFSDDANVSTWQPEVQESVTSLSVSNVKKKRGESPTTIVLTIKKLDDDENLLLVVDASGGKSHQVESSSSPSSYVSPPHRAGVTVTTPIHPNVLQPQAVCPNLNGSTTFQPPLLTQSSLLLSPAKKNVVSEALKDEDGDVYFGPALKDVYARCCEKQKCRPNSYLLKKLPENPRFTSTIEELDMSCNYLGHTGFVALLHFLDHLPKLKTIFVNDMSLDNSDVENLCTILANHATITTIHLRKNSKVTLPAAKYLTKLCKVNPRIKELRLEGTSIGGELISKLEIG